MLDRLNQTKLLVASAVLLTAFLVLAGLRFLFNTVNLDLNIWAASINSGFFLWAAKGISVVFDATTLSAFTLATAALMLAKKHGRYGALLLVAMVGDLVLVEVSKALTASLRPTNEVFNAIGYSFPSGHVTGNVIFFGVITYFAWVHWCSVKARITTATLYSGVIAVVGFDRIYLNVHWLSDVVGGVFLGAFWLTFCILIFRHAQNKHWSLSKRQINQNLVNP
jgi:undecaprenyl-diphosphatase